jgi:hypothetical protein
VVAGSQKRPNKWGLHLATKGAHHLSVESGIATFLLGDSEHSGGNLRILKAGTLWRNRQELDTIEALSLFISPTLRNPDV